MFVYVLNMFLYTKICLLIFVGTSGLSILNLFTTKSVQIQCIQNIQFSINIRRSR